MKLKWLNLSKWKVYRGETGVLSLPCELSTEDAEWFPQASPSDVEQRMAKGCLPQASVLFESAEEILYRSDLVNSRPIFYMQDGSLIADSIAALPCGMLNESAMKELLMAGYVTGSRTLFENVFKSQSGELMKFQRSGITSTSCFSYSYGEAESRISVADAKQQSEVFLGVLDAAISQAVARASGAGRIVVPLSGGHDSRLLISRLAALGVENVLCYSYGRADNEQSRISRQVAEALGYPWHFVEYTEGKWQALHEAGVIEAYARFAFRGSSIPHLQDFLAVHELHEKGVIASGDLCMPGHTLDFLSGGHVGKADFDCDDANSAVTRVLQRHFPGLPDDGAGEPQLVARIYELFEAFEGPPSQFQEWFNWRERQTKFIVNSCAAYEFHGLQVALPFWNVDVVRYWLSVPPEVKAGRRFYFEMEPHLLDPRLRDIPFANDGKGKQSPVERAQLALRQSIPTWLSSRLVRLSRLRRRQNEGLNLAFAGLGGDIRSALPHLASHLIAEWPPIRDILCRRPYQLNGHRMAALYTLNLLIADQSVSASP